MYNNYSRILYFSNLKNLEKSGIEKSLSKEEISQEHSCISNTNGIGSLSLRIQVLSIIFPSVLTYCFISPHSLKELIIYQLFALYFGILVLTALKRYLINKQQRQVAYFLPIRLESLSLLVQSGLAVLPAIGQIVQQARKMNQNDPVVDCFEELYELSSSGLTFSNSLKKVVASSKFQQLRYVLIHLDISVNEGGELLPSIENLITYSQKQWKLNIQERIRKLENNIVFPVFASVIGLFLVVSAVPLVPVIEFMDSIDSKSPNSPTAYVKFDR